MELLPSLIWRLKVGKVLILSWTGDGHWVAPWVSSFPPTHQVRCICNLNLIWYWRNSYSILPAGHLNPAVTMALVIARDFSWKKLPFYWLAQYVGALAASATVIGIYYGIRLISIFHITCVNIDCAVSLVTEPIIQSQINIEFPIGQNDTEPGIVAIFSNNPSHTTALIPRLVEEVGETTNSLRSRML